MHTAYKYRLNRLSWNKIFHVCLFENGLMVLLVIRLRRGFATLGWALGKHDFATI